MKGRLIVGMPCSWRVRVHAVGFTLIEALVASMIGMVLLVAVGIGVGKLLSVPNDPVEASTGAENNNLVEREADHIVQIAAKLKKMHESPGGYSGLTAERAIAFHAVPPVMVKNSSTLVSSWGGVELGPASTTGIERFGLVYQAVPSPACIQLVLKLRTAGWTALTVNGNVVGENPPMGGIEAACASDSNTIVFVGG